MAIRLLLIDDHSVVRTGLRMLLEGEADVEIVAEAGTAEEGYKKALKHKPDLILLDIGLPDESGISLAGRLKKRLPGCALVALTIHEDEEYFFRMLDAGVSGYVPKRAAPGELITAIRTAAKGEVYLYPTLAKLLVKDYLSQDNQGRKQRTLNGLTSREQEVLAHLADGESNTEIGESLSISPKTVARHRENIMRKLNLHSRTELVRYAIRKGIINP
jgi:two-component system response regulator NreC